MRQACRPSCARTAGEETVVRRNCLSYTELAMRQAASVSIVLAVCWGQTVWAQQGSWNKIRYLGGTVQANVNPYDWNTTLTVRPGVIVLVFAPRQTVSIQAANVVSLSSGQEAHRRVAGVVALGAAANPLALFGLLHASKSGLAGILYHREDGKPAAVLLDCKRNGYAAILKALETATGKPVDNSP
jgi:hypothetical protein